MLVEPQPFAHVDFNCAHSTHVPADTCEYELNAWPVTGIVVYSILLHLTQ